jgi:hypothetical protein
VWLLHGSEYGNMEEQVAHSVGMALLAMQYT